MMKLRIYTLLILLVGFYTLQAQDEVYELRTYELIFGKPASTLHDFFEKALIPALNRQGVDNVGAFEEVGEAMPKKMYLLIPYENIQTFQSVNEALYADAKFLEDAKAYLKAEPESMPYRDYSSNLIRSTAGFPNLVKPADDATYFELRIYGSYNEDAHRRKVKMFNESEFDIFKDVGLPTVFFGSNIAGTQLPCLTYMLAFKDKEAHADAWAKFGPHPEWQRIIKLDEYQDAMNSITRVFLKPLAYSQL